MRLFVSISVMLLAALACLAAPTGLLTMPTAETLGLGAVRLSADYKSQHFYANDEKWIGGIQAGAIFGLEAGIDEVGSKPVANAKWRFMSDLLLPAVAVGVQNLASGKKPQLYAVATKSLIVAKSAVSLGVLRDGADVYHTMLGATAGFGPISVQAEQLHADHLNQTNAGLSFSTSGLTFTGIVYNVTKSSRTLGGTVSYTLNLMPLK